MSSRFPQSPAVKLALVNGITTQVNDPKCSSRTTSRASTSRTT
jgi:hypothetical protein